jgi:hypothetical protein
MFIKMFISLSSFFLRRCVPTRSMASSFFSFPDHTQRRPRVGKTPLDERSARGQDLYLTTHNIHDRQNSVPPTGFDLKSQQGGRPQNYAFEYTILRFDTTSFETVFNHNFDSKNCKHNNNLITRDSSN